MHAFREILRIVSGLALLAGCGAVGGTAFAQGPSFSCVKTTAGSIEELICGDRELSQLDRRLADIYSQASQKAVNEHPPMLKAEQRGWIKGRDECWKSDDRRKCVEEEYKRRIAELQARYRLLSGTAPIVFICNGNRSDEVVATFFQTDPPTLIAERGDSVSLMYLQPAGSGARYQGRNESFWEHQGEALVTWGYDAPEMRCTGARSPLVWSHSAPPDRSYGLSEVSTRLGADHSKLL